ncbi:MAG TPA: SH3 domain-containing protein, partial [Anaerolineales bacterium]|nr:SH3 domain-containing protein [Anaerolineales bacterium]
QNVSIYSGPGTQFSIIGSIAAGQTVQVTGINVNVDGKWRRVICPDNSIGSCWVSADTNLTRPTGLDGNADVQIVEIQILESYPLQVNAVARGQLPDAGCTTISSVNQIREGNLFKVSLKTRTDPLAFCAQILTPFEYVIPLEVGSLLAGRYIVNVNGVEASFDLPESVYPTDVEYVMAQRDVAIYSGPGSQHGVIGSIASGQTAKVTGVSADGNWWRVICPDNSIGSCWASANSADTQPTHWQ